MTTRTGSVKGHSRRTKSGRTTTVRPHKRTMLGPNPGHAGKMAGRAIGHGRKGRKGLAVTFALIALIEIVLWVVLNGTALVAAVAAGILACIAVLFATRSWSR